MIYHERPVAVLIARDGYEQIVSIAYPFPPTYEVAILQRYSVLPDAEPPSYQSIPRRVFKRSNMLSAEHRWWRVYNEGRSGTPEAVPVYLEDGR